MLSIKTQDSIFPDNIIYIGSTQTIYLPAVITHGEDFMLRTFVITGENLKAGNSISSAYMVLGENILTPFLRSEDFAR